ncbi:hypothetical protein [Micromonospora sp. SH-82]|uniref:hypothetical protein n=1 Tax=Micromonospora sp. SH-82 TaxID=3132938 RepID=UPI003EBCA615
MTDRDQNRRPLEETPEAAAAVDDESTVPQLRTGGGADRNDPGFTGPGDRPATSAETDDLIGDPYGGGTGAGGKHIRTGGEQEWEPADLVAARGQDPTAENLDRARRDLAEHGNAAVERTVP